MDGQWKAGGRSWKGEWSVEGRWKVMEGALDLRRELGIERAHAIGGDRGEIREIRGDARRSEEMHLRLELGLEGALGGEVLFGAVGVVGAHGRDLLGLRRALRLLAAQAAEVRGGVSGGQRRSAGGQWRSATA